VVLTASILMWPALLSGRHIVAAGPALAVDASRDRHTISPDIYGMNFGDPALMAELRTPVDRRGGNRATRYNYRNNTSNTAADYYYENIVEDQSADQFIDSDRSAGARSMITVPLIGYVAKDSPANHPFTCSFSVAKHGGQRQTDPYDPNCGDGVRPDGTRIAADPLDTSIPIDPAFVRGWVNHLIARYGTAARGGVQLYGLDNEPFIWNTTHRDVRPTPVGYDELRDRTYAYAAAVKAADPGALVLGPSDWGWSAYVDANSATDNRASHGGVDFGPWYLQQMRAYEQAYGVRILDYFDEHYYPQASGVSLGPAGSANTQAIRLRSTRALWDPTHTDESWIGQPVNLIPRFRQWIAANYPGTRLAIGEYNWGGLESLNGALAQADVLGIFGREGVDLAAIWDPPAPNQPGAYAFRIYRNYDGHGGTYGDTWVRSTSADQGQLAIYGAQRGSDGALTLVVINKTGASLQSPLSLAGFTPAAAAQVYRYSGADLSAIVRQPDMPVAASGFTATYPANSITLVVVPTAPPPPRSAPPPRPSDPVPNPPPALSPPGRDTGGGTGSPAPLPARR
jgi:hypothetical protein